MKTTLPLTVLLCAGLFCSSNSYANTYYWTGSSSSNWNTLGNWALSSCGGSTPTSLPGTGDSVVFSGSCSNNNCNINVSISILSFRIDNAYTGTVTQSSGDAITVAYGKFADGTFSGSGAAITFSSSLTIEGGTFTTTSGTTTLEGNFSYTGGTFNHNNGRIVFYKTLTVSGVNSSSSISLYDVEFQAAAGNSTITLNNIILNVADSTLLTGSNNLFINSSQTTSVINAGGEVKIYNTSGTGGGTSTIVVNGSSTQHLTGNATTEDVGKLPNLKINSTGTVYLIGFITMGGSTTLTYTAGTINVGTSKVVFYYDNTITGSMTFNNVEFQGTSSTCIVSNTITVNSNLYTTSTGQIVINTGTINLYGNFAISNTSVNTGGSATVNFTGTNNDSIIASSGVTSGEGYLPQVTLNKTGGTLYFKGQISLSGNWTNNYSTANINPGTANFYIYYPESDNTIGGTYSTPVWNAQFVGGNYAGYTIGEDSALIVKNNLTLSGSESFSLSGHSINVYGNIIASNSSGGAYGSTILNLVGSESDSIISPSGYIGGECYLPSITVNKTGGTLYLIGIVTLANWTNNYSETNINPGTSTVYFYGENTIGGSYRTPVWNAQFAGGDYDYYSIGEDSALIVKNNLTLSGYESFQFYNHSINIYGNIIASNNNGGVSGSSTVFNLVGSKTDSIISSSGYTLGECYLPAININKTGNTLTLIGNITEGYNWTYVNGTINAGTSTVGMYGNGYTLTGATGSDTMSFNNVVIAGNTSLGSALKAAGNLTINSSEYLATTSSNYQITLAGNWINNGTYYYNSSNVTFNGSLTDSIKGSTNTTFYSLTLDKTGTVALRDPVTVTNSLTLTNGDIISSSTDLLTLNNGSSVTGGSDNSFVSGPIKKIGNSSFTFPTGAGSSYHPIGIGAPSSTTDAFTAQYYNSAPASRTTTDDSLTYVSACDYWNLARTTGSSNVKVTLEWGTGSCDIKRLSSLRVGYWNGSEWTNLGQSANTGSTTTGTVTASTTSTAFGNNFAISKHSPTPTVNAGSAATICYGSSTGIGGSPTATGGFSPYTYSWSPATALSSSTVANPTASPTATTTYTVTVNDNDNAPTATTTVVVTVDPELIINAGTSKAVCYGISNDTLGGSPTVSGGTSPYTYSWASTPSGFTSGIANPIINPSVTTTYSLTLTDDKGCSVNSSVNILADPQLFASAGTNQTTCGGSRTLLGGVPAASGGTFPYSYSWSPNSSLDDTSILANPIASPTVTTTYGLTVTDSNGCIASNSVVDSILSNPTSSAGSDKIICQGTNVTIGGAPSASGSASPFQYLWTPNTYLNSSNVANPTANPIVNTTYILSILDTNYCWANDTMVVVVNPLPTVNSGVNTSIIDNIADSLGGKPTVFGGASPYTYLWSPSTGLNSSTISNPTALPSTTTKYVLLVEDSLGCTSKDSVIVNVLPFSMGRLGTYALLSNDSIMSDSAIYVSGEVGAKNHISSNITASDSIQINTGGFSDAIINLDTAINQLNRLSGSTISNNLSGQILTPGVYKITGTATLNGILTLQGNGSSSFVFDISDSFIVDKNSYIVLDNVNFNQVYFNIGETFIENDTVTLNGIFMTSDNFDPGNILGNIEVWSKRNVVFHGLSYPLAGTRSNLVTATLDATANHSIPPDYFGANAGSFVSTASINSFNTSVDVGTTEDAINGDSLHIGTFRFPSGDLANGWDWQAGWFFQPNQLPKDIQEPIYYYQYRGFSGVDDNFANFKRMADSLGSAPMLTLNMIDSNIDYQMGLLFAANCDNLPVKYIELGNEFYLPGTIGATEKFPDPNGGGVYINDVKAWAQRIHSVFPNAELSAPANVYSWGGARAENWNAQMQPYLYGSGLTALSFHIYEASGLGGLGLCDIADANAVLAEPEDTMDNIMYDQNANDMFKYCNNNNLDAWVTEYNDKEQITGLNGSWLQALFNASLTLHFLEYDKITHLTFQDYIDQSSEGELLLNSSACGGGSAGDFTANGYANSLIAAAIRFSTNAQKIDFTGSSDPPLQTITLYNKTYTIYGLYGWSFTGPSYNQAIILNLSSDAVVVNLNQLNFSNNTDYYQIIGVEPNSNQCTVFNEAAGCISSSSDLTFTPSNYPGTIIASSLDLSNFTIPAYSILRLIHCSDVIKLSPLGGQVETSCADGTGNCITIGGNQSLALVANGGSSYSNLNVSGGSGSPLIEQNNLGNVFIFNPNNISSGTFNVHVQGTCLDGNPETSNTIAITVVNLGYTPSTTTLSNCGTEFDFPSGANYQWIPTYGLNTGTSNIVIANPSVPTSYTVYIDDGTSGCEAVQEVVTPVFEMQQSSAVICNHAISGSCTEVESNENVTIGPSTNPYLSPYSWSSTPEDPSISGVTTYNVTVSPTITTTYTLTATGPGGCSSSRTTVVIVYDCCCAPSGGLTVGPLDSISDIYTKSLPTGVTITYGLTTTYTGDNYYTYALSSTVPIVINGIFKIDNQEEDHKENILDINNSQISFGPYAQIKIPQSDQLNIKNSTLNAACGGMWQGITAIGFPSEVSILGSTIADAICPLTTNDAVILNIGSQSNLNTFIDNDTDLYISNVHPPSNIPSGYPYQYQLQIEDNTFTTSTSNGLLSLSPFHGQQAYAGIVLSNPYYPTTIGEPSQMNAFLNKQFGVLSEATDLSLYDNTFSNITAIPSAMQSINYIYPPGGTAVFQSNTGYPIYFNGNGTSEDNSSSPQLAINNATIGVITGGNNIFRNCTNGIYSIGTNMKIYNNTIGTYYISHAGIIPEPVFFGIQIIGSNSSTSFQDIENNQIYRTKKAIQIIDIPDADYKLTVDGNGIRGIGNGITIDNHINSTRKSEIKSNLIWMSQISPTSLTYGIRLVNSSKMTLEQNDIAGSSSGVKNERGISLSDNDYAWLICNNTNSTEFGLQFQSNNTHITTQGNSLYGYSEGFVLGESGISQATVINPQGTVSQTTGNDFYNSSSSTPDLYNYNTGENNIQINYYVGADPYPPNYTRPTGSKFDITPTASESYYTCSSSVGGGVGTCCSSTSVDVEYDSSIVNNGLSISTSDAPLTYFTLKKNLYKNGLSALYDSGFYSLSSEVSAGLISSALSSNFTAFFDTMPDNNMGKFVQIDNYIHLMGDSAITIDSLNVLVKTALQTDSLVNDVYIFESNLKSIDSIYLKTFSFGNYGFDSSQIAALYSIAIQCPYTGGEGVFDARALLKLINDTTNYDDSALCASEEIDVSKRTFISPKDSNYSFNLFPNPANSTVNLSYNLGLLNSAQLFLYDMMGRELLVINLDSKNNFVTIDVSNMSPGLYYARVTTTAKNIFGSKFSVIR